MCLQDICLKTVQLLLRSYAIEDSTLLQNKILTLIAFNETRKCMKKEHFYYWYLKAFHHTFICTCLTPECGRVKSVQQFCANEIVQTMESALEDLINRGVIEEQRCNHNNVILVIGKNSKEE